ncbi:MAG: 30S ribosomal protein S5 [Planctomycetota bacterium]|nr:MAG: 30S ribosomal protein S5 [Planctomycetota bacterium]
MVSQGESPNSPERVVQIRRCACVVKGGRRFSFTALVVVGDSNGKCGVGYSKGSEVPVAVDKATKQAQKRFEYFPVIGTSIPHAVEARYGSSHVKLMPAPAGTGIIASATVRAVMESVGIKDILTKKRGSSNPANVVKATMMALAKLRTRDDVARLRGVEI